MADITSRACHLCQCPVEHGATTNLCCQARFHENCLMGYQAFASASGKKVSCPKCGGDPSKPSATSQQNGGAENGSVPTDEFQGSSGSQSESKDSGMFSWIFGDASSDYENPSNTIMSDFDAILDGTSTTTAKLEKTEKPRDQMNGQPQATPSLRPSKEVPIPPPPPPPAPKLPRIQEARLPPPPPPAESEGAGDVGLSPSERAGEKKMENRASPEAETPKPSEGVGSPRKGIAEERMGEPAAEAEIERLRSEHRASLLRERESAAALDRERERLREVEAQLHRTRQDANEAIEKEKRIAASYQERIAAMESSESSKDQSTSSQLSQMEARISELGREKEHLFEDLEAKRRENEALHQEKKEFQVQMGELAKALEHEKRLSAEKEERVAQLQEEVTSHVNALKSKPQVDPEAFAKAEADYAEQLKGLQQQHASDLTGLREEYEAQQNLQVKQIEALQLELQKSNADLQRTGAELSKAKTSSAQLMDKFRKLVDQCKKQQTAYKNLSSQHTALRSHAQKAQMVVAQLKSRLQRAEAHAGESAKAKQEIDQLRAERQNLSMQLRTVSSQKEEQEQEIARLTSVIQSQKEEEGKAMELESKLRSAKEEIEKLRVDADSVKNLEANLQNQMAQTNALQSQVTQWQEKSKELMASNEEIRSELQQELDEARRQLTLERNNVQMLRTNAEVLKQELEQAEEQTGQLRAACQREAQNTKQLRLQVETERSHSQTLSQQLQQASEENNKMRSEHREEIENMRRQFAPDRKTVQTLRQQLEREREESMKKYEEFQQDSTAKAQRILLLQKERRAETQQLQEEIRELRAKEASLGEDCHRAKLQMNQINQKLMEQQNLARRSQSEIDKLRQSLEEVTQREQQLNNEMSRIKTDLQNAQSQLRENREATQAKDAELEDLQSRLYRSESSVKELGDKASGYESARSELLKWNSSWQFMTIEQIARECVNSLEDLDTKVKGSSEDVKRADTEKEKAKAASAKASAQAQELMKRLKTAVTKVKESRESATKSQNQLKSFAQKYTKTVAMTQKLKGALEKSMQKIKALQGAVESRDQKVKELEDKFSEQTRTSEESSKLKVEHEALRERSEELEEEIAKLREQIGEHESSSEKSTARIAELEEAQGTLQSKVESLSEDLDRAHESLEKMNTGYKEELDKLREEKKAVEEEKEKLQIEHEKVVEKLQMDFETQGNETKEKIESIKKELQEKSQELTELQKELEEAEAACEEAEERNTELTGDTLRMKDSMGALENSNKELKEKVDEMTKKVREVQTTLEEKEKLLEERDERIGKLEEAAGSSNSEAVATLEKEQADAKASLEKAERDHEAKIADLEKELDKSRKMALNFETQIKTLQEQAKNDGDSEVQANQKVTIAEGKIKTLEIDLEALSTAKAKLEEELNTKLSAAESQLSAQKLQLEESKSEVQSSKSELQKAEDACKEAEGAKLKLEKENKMLHSRIEALEKAQQEKAKAAPAAVAVKPQTGNASGGAVTKDELNMLKKKLVTSVQRTQKYKGIATELQSRLKAALGKLKLAEAQGKQPGPENGEASLPPTPKTPPPLDEQVDAKNAAASGDGAKIATELRQEAQELKTKLAGVTKEKEKIFEELKALRASESSTKEKLEQITELHSRFVVANAKNNHHALRAQLLKGVVAHANGGAKGKGNSKMPRLHSQQSVILSHMEDGCDDASAPPATADSKKEDSLSTAVYESRIKKLDAQLSDKVKELEVSKSTLSELDGKVQKLESQLKEASAARLKADTELDAAKNSEKESRLAVEKLKEKYKILEEEAHQASAESESAKKQMRGELDSITNSLKAAQERATEAEKNATEARALAKRASGASKGVERAYKRVLGLVRSWESYDKKEQLRRKEIDDARKEKEKKKQEEEEAKQAAERKKEEASMMGKVSRLFGGKKVIKAHMKQRKSWFDEKTGKYVFENDDGAEDELSEGSGGGFPHPPYVGPTLPAWEDLVAISDNADETEADTAGGDTDQTPGKRVHPKVSPPAGGARMPVRRPRSVGSRYGAVPGMSGFGGSGAGRSAPPRAQAPRVALPAMRGGLPRMMNIRKPMVPNAEKKSEMSDGAAAGTAGNKPAQPMVPVKPSEGPKTLPSPAMSNKTPPSQSGSDPVTPTKRVRETPGPAKRPLLRPRKIAHPRTTGPGSKVNVITNPGARPMPGLAKKQQPLKPSMPQPRGPKPLSPPLSGAPPKLSQPVERLAPPLQQQDTEKPSVAEAKHSLAVNGDLRGLETMLGMKIYPGAGITLRKSPSGNGSVVASLNVRIRELEQSLKVKSEEAVAAAAAAAPAGGNHQIVAKGEDEEKEREFKLLVQRLRRAEARLSNRDRQAAHQALRPAALMKAVRIHRNDNLVTISITLSKFSMAAACSMFASVFAAGSLGNVM